MLDVPKSEHVLEALYGTMQTFRLLGFPSDNLYVAFGIIAPVGPFKGHKCVAVQLNWGDKSFRYTIAPVRNDRKFARQWEVFAEAANLAPADDPALFAMRDACEANRKRDELIAALARAGIKPPAGDN